MIVFTAKINPKERCYELWIQDVESFDIHQTTVDIATSLIADNFEFCSISSGGGTSEVSHSGVTSYNVKYTNFSDFKKNFLDDYDDAEFKVHKETGGWVSFCDYNHFYLYLKKGIVRLVVFVSTSQRILIRVYDFDGSFDIDSTIKNLIVLGKPVEIESYPCYIETNKRILKNREYFEKTFLANWTNESLD